MSTCSNFVLREGGSKRCFRNCMLQFCRELVVGGLVVCLLQGVAEDIKGFIRRGAADISNDEEGGNSSEEQYGEDAYRDTTPLSAPLCRRGATRDNRSLRRTCEGGGGDRGSVWFIRNPF